MFMIGATLNQVLLNARQMDGPWLLILLIVALACTGFLIAVVVKDWFKDRRGK